jgi:hypothetical protein
MYITADAPLEMPAGRAWQERPVWPSDRPAQGLGRAPAGPRFCLWRRQWQPEPDQRPLPAVTVTVPVAASGEFRPAGPAGCQSPGAGLSPSARLVGLQLEVAARNNLNAPCQPH